MQVIPVLDLINGLVVLASGGRRDSYRPVDTPLCRDPSPVSVIDSMLRVFPFKIFYIADIDAIGGESSNADLIESLACAQPGIEFWVDAGFTDSKDLALYTRNSNVRLVIGSESLESLESYVALCRDQRLERHILSLDRKDGIELGSSDIINQAHLWPEIVISMDLTRVGQAVGPNVQRIREIGNKRQGLNVVAAGGIRDVNDLLSLKANGVRYALVATALHNGTLSTADLKRLV